MQHFEPDQLVLVRECDTADWELARYSHCCTECSNGHIHHEQGWRWFKDDEILPYTGNEQLLGTTGQPAPKWEPKPGELVAARNKHDIWLPAIFCARKRLLTGEEAFTIQWFDRKERLVEEVEPLREHFTIPEE